MLHQGACSDTTEWNGRVMLGDNYEASKALFKFATERGIPLVYASSAAVYGMGPDFREDPECERPLVYHAAGGSLRCHLCGTAAPMASRCQSSEKAM